MSYAADTSVSVAKSRSEIQEMVTRAGAKQFGSMDDDGKATILFSLKDRRVMFELNLPRVEAHAFRLVRGHKKANAPDQQHKAWEQACRSRWRALALAIKAKLVSVEAGIESFEEAFLPHIVVPHDGRAVRFATVATKAIHDAYVGGKLPPMLGSGS